MLYVTSGLQNAKGSFAKNCFVAEVSGCQVCPIKTRHYWFAVPTNRTATTRGTCMTHLRSTYGFTRIEGLFPQRRTGCEALVAWPGGSGGLSQSNVGTLQEYREIPGCLHWQRLKNAIQVVRGTPGILEREQTLIMRRAEMKNGWWRSLRAAPLKVALF